MTQEARESSFDALARALAGGTISRRKALKLAGAAVLGTMLGSSTLLARAQAAEKAKVCKEDAECPTGTTCIKKQCVTSEGCPAGYTLCEDGLCYDLQTNRCNCGACGKRCAGSGEGRCCENGLCTPGGLSDCPLPPDPDYCQPGIEPVKV